MPFFYLLRRGANSFSDDAWQLRGVHSHLAYGIRGTSTVTDSPVATATATAFPNYFGPCHDEPQKTIRWDYNSQNIRLEIFAQLSIIQNPVKDVKLESRGEDKHRLIWYRV